MRGGQEERDVNKSNSSYLSSWILDKSQNTIFQDDGVRNSRLDPKMTKKENPHSCEWGFYNKQRKFIS